MPNIYMLFKFFTLFSDSPWLFAELAVKRAERFHDLKLKLKRNLKISILTQTKSKTNKNRDTF